MQIDLARGRCHSLILDDALEGWRVRRLDIFLRATPSSRWLACWHCVSESSWATPMQPDRGHIVLWFLQGNEATRRRQCDPPWYGEHQVFSGHPTRRLSTERGVAHLSKFSASFCQDGHSPARPQLMGWSCGWCVEWEALQTPPQTHTHIIKSRAPPYQFVFQCHILIFFFGTALVFSEHWNWQLGLIFNGTKLYGAMDCGRSTFFMNESRCGKPINWPLLACRCYLFLNIMSMNGEI